MDESFLRKLCFILNGLLTECPFETGGGWDFGWYCREHSLVTKLVHAHAGIECEIVRGHVAAYVSGKKTLSTEGTGSDHVWCVTDEFVPCDLSMTFRHFSGYPDFNPPILGCENNGSFSIVYCEHVADFPEALAPDVNAIYFAPVSALTYKWHHYLDNPTILLETAEAGHISLAIAAYVLDKADGVDVPLSGDIEHGEHLKWLKHHYPAPSRHLRKKLRGRTR